MIKVNKEYPEVLINGKKYFLTKKEFDVFSFLFENKGKICTRSLIFNNIWGNNYFSSERVVDIVITRIRKKLTQVKIETKKGFGYSLIV